MSKRTAIAAALCAAMVLGAQSAPAMTADEILDKVGNLFSAGENDADGVLATMTIHNAYPGGVDSEYTLAVFELTAVEAAKPDDADETTWALMVFLGGDEAGSVIVLKTPEDDALESQMWIYLPALGVTKELVSDEDQARSFAGSSLSYGDLGGVGDLQDDYDATILREETLDVAGETFDVWVLELVAVQGTNADHDRVLLWVSKDDYLSLRMESYSSSRVLEGTMEFRELGEFEGDRIPAVIYSTDLEEGTATTITIVGTRRPDAPLTVDLFAPGALGQLDPTAYGF
jgi:hypothetical protein